MEAHLVSLEAFVIIAVLLTCIFGAKRLRQAIRSSLKSLRSNESNR